MDDLQTNNARKKLDDPDIRLAEKALRRAALKARERARRFGHGIIIYENGKSEYAFAAQKFLFVIFF